MLKSLMNIGVVLLYGLFDSGKNDYKSYLDFVAKEIIDKKLNKIIMCGGYTDPKNPNESEASSVVKYLKTIIPDFTDYILEDRSISTNQNLEFAAKYIVDIGDGVNNITVYCDSTRLAKVIWMSLHFLLNETQENIYQELFDFTHRREIKTFVFKNLSVIGFNFPNKTKEEIIGQSFSTLLDVMAVYNEKYNQLNLEQRKKDFGLK